LKQPKVTGPPRAAGAAATAGVSSGGQEGEGTRQVDDLLGQQARARRAA